MESYKSQVSLTIAAYNDARQVPNSNQQIIRDIALKFTVLAKRISGATRSGSIAHSHRQALTETEEDV